MEVLVMESNNIERCNKVFDYNIGDRIDDLISVSIHNNDFELMRKLIKKKDDLYKGWKEINYSVYKNSSYLENNLIKFNKG